MSASVSSRRLDLLPWLGVSLAIAAIPALLGAMGAMARAGGFIPIWLWPLSTVAWLISVAVMFKRYGRRGWPVLLGVPLALWWVPMAVFFFYAVSRGASFV